MVVCAQMKSLKTAAEQSCSFYCVVFHQYISQSLYSVKYTKNPCYYYIPRINNNRQCHAAVPYYEDLINPKAFVMLAFLGLLFREQFLF